MPEFSFHARRFNRDDEDADGVVDGDTHVLQIDLGFYQWFVETIRLQGVDTHETHFVSHDSEEYKRGMKEMGFVRDWYEEAESDGFDNDYHSRWPVELIVTQYDAYGKYPRIIGKVRRKIDGEHVTTRLLEEFDGVEYD